LNATSAGRGTSKINSRRKHGNLVHLHERDLLGCIGSISRWRKWRRRFGWRRKSGGFALRRVKIRQKGRVREAGTVEFLDRCDSSEVVLHRSDSPYPGGTYRTVEVTGIDIVREQFQVAMGEWLHAKYGDPPGEQIA